MVNSRNEPTSSQGESSHTDTSHTTADNIDGIRLKCGVDVIPNEPGADFGCVAVRVISNVVELGHRDVHALCGREARVGRMAAPLDLVVNDSQHAVFMCVSIDRDGDESSSDMAIHLDTYRKRRVGVPQNLEL